MDLFRAYLFRGLDAHQMESVSSIAMETPLEKGQQIFTEGEEDGRIYIVKEGAVELTTRIENGLDLPISMLRDPGDLFGVSALLPPYRYSLSSRCAKRGSLLYIERKRLEKLMSEDKALALSIISNLAEYFLNRLKETRNELKIHFKTILMSTRS